MSLFIGFSIFEILRKSDNPVLELLEPTVIQVDLNSNQTADVNETFCIPNIQTFTSDLGKNQNELAKSLKLSNEEVLKLGYLTDNFAENILSNKRVKIKPNGNSNANCRYADVLISNESYREKLVNSGFAFYNGKPLNESAYKKNLEKVQKLKLVILNHKSNKFHKLDCKYGLVAHDVILIPENQIPKEAAPCKFCHITKEELKKTSFVPTYPLVISNGSLKMFLTDLTTTLKPDGRCSSLICKELLAQINNSKTSIDIAIYGWDTIPDILNALKSAKSRGVKINLVYDTSENNYYPDTVELIELADKSSTETPKILMHNKFIIFDDNTVLTGSMNFAKTGLSGFNSNCIFLINSAEIASMYKEEFNQMLNGKFHNSKKKVNHKTVSMNNTKITPFFSPKDNTIVTNIIPIINEAKTYIYIPSFILTHDELSSAFISAKQRGVNVKIITDATNTTARRSKVKMLRENGIPVKVENYAGKLHSKSIIIDDKYIIAGSMNFSNSGENKNDENCLIIEDTRLAKYYKGFFEYLWEKIPDKYLKVNPRPEGKSSIGSCFDGIDNNYDGKIDMQDDACKP